MLVGDGEVYTPVSVFVNSFTYTGDSSAVSDHMKAYLIMAEYSYFFHIDFLLIKSDYAKLIAEGKFAEADELERLLIEAELLMVVFSIL